MKKDVAKKDKDQKQNEDLCSGYNFLENKEDFYYPNVEREERDELGKEAVNIRLQRKDNLIRKKRE